MSRARLITATLLLSAATALPAQAPAARWWAHVSFLADDRMKGRETGSPEHREAAEYVARHFKDAGLKPGGTDGYFQPVHFTSRKIVEDKSSLALVRGVDRRAGGARRRSDVQHADRSGATGRGAARVRRLRVAGAGGEARRSRGPRSQRQGRPSADGRPLVYPGTAARALPEHALVVSQAGRRHRRRLDSEPERAGHPVGPIEARALFALDGDCRSGTRRDRGSAAGRHGQSGLGGEVLRRHRAHLQGAARAVERRPGAAALRGACVDSRDGRRRHASR